MASSTTPTRRTRVGWTASGACTSGSTARHSVATRQAPGGAATTSTKASQTMNTQMNTSAGPMGAHRSRVPVRSGDFVPDNLVTPRKKKRKQNEFATRTYLHPGAAADPGRRVVGSSDLAGSHDEEYGHGLDNGYGSRVVPGDLGRDDDRDDVSRDSHDEPGFRAGPA